MLWACGDRSGTSHFSAAHRGPVSRSSAQKRYTEEKQRSAEGFGSQSICGRVIARLRQKSKNMVIVPRGML
jgi:hypothetical protein